MDDLRAMAAILDDYLEVALGGIDCADSITFSTDDGTVIHVLS